MTSDTQRFELDGEHTAQIHKYTVQQPRFIVNRLVFPEASSTACVVSAGYANGSSNVWGSEGNRKAHVRQMLNRSAHDQASLSDLDTMDMTAEQLIAWHTRLVYDPKASIKERQASAIELARLKGYRPKATGEQGDNQNFMNMLEARKAELDAQSAMPTVFATA